MIILDRLYAHAPVSLARGFFRHFFSSPLWSSESTVRATFFACPTPPLEAYWRAARASITIAIAPFLCIAV